MCPETQSLPMCATDGVGRLEDRSSRPSRQKIVRNSRKKGKSALMGPCGRRTGWNSETSSIVEGKFPCVPQANVDTKRDFGSQRSLQTTLQGTTGRLDRLEALLYDCVGYAVWELVGEGKLEGLVTRSQIILRRVASHPSHTFLSPPILPTQTVVPGIAEHRPSIVIYIMCWQCPLCCCMVSGTFQLDPD